MPADKAVLTIDSTPKEIASSWADVSGTQLSGTVQALQASVLQLQTDVKALQQQVVPLDSVSTKINKLWHDLGRSD